MYYLCMNTIICALSLFMSTITHQRPPMHQDDACPEGRCIPRDVSYVENTLSNQDITYVKTIAASIRNSPPEKTKALISLAMISQDARFRAAACFVAQSYGIDYVEDLVANVGDTDPLTQQCARHTLMLLASRVKTGALVARPADAGKAIDFGPTINSNNAQIAASQAMWKLWFNSLTEEHKSLITQGRKITVDSKVTNKKEKK